MERVATVSRGASSEPSLSSSCLRASELPPLLPRAAGCAIWPPSALPLAAEPPPTSIAEPLPLPSPPPSPLAVELPPPKPEPPPNAEPPASPKAEPPPPNTEPALALNVTGFTGGRFLAVDETVILLHLPSAGVSKVMERERQQNDRLVNGGEFRLPESGTASPTAAGTRGGGRRGGLAAAPRAEASVCGRMAAEAQGEAVRLSSSRWLKEGCARPKRWHAGRLDRVDHLFQFRVCLSPSPRTSVTESGAGTADGCRLGGDRPCRLLLYILIVVSPHLLSPETTD